MLDHSQRTSSMFARNASLAITAVGTAFLLLVWGAGAAWAVVQPVPLDTADSFVVLAGTEVSATGPNTLNGDLGIYPGSSLTGLGTITIIGTEYVANGVAQQAQADLTTAYLNAEGQGPALTLTPADLGGMTLTAGVYTVDANIELTGVLELNAEGNPDALFVIQATSGLTVNSGASVSLINDAKWCNVFWQVDSTATIGSGASFVGSILALTSITLADGATVEGRALARNGNVTMINNTFTTPACTPASAGTTDTPVDDSPSAGVTVTPVGGVQTGDGSTAVAAGGVDSTFVAAGTVSLLVAVGVVFAVLTRRRLGTV